MPHVDGFRSRVDSHHGDQRAGRPRCRPLAESFLAKKIGTLANWQKEKPRNLDDSEVCFRGDGGVEFHVIVHT
jgi:hypothetical protein